MWRAECDEHHVGLKSFRGKGGRPSFPDPQLLSGNQALATTSFAKEVACVAGYKRGQILGLVAVNDFHQQLHFLKKKWLVSYISGLPTVIPLFYFAKLIL